MSPAPVAPPDDGLGLLRSLLESAGGFVLGAAVTLVTFRTQLSKIDGRIKAHDKEFEAHDQRFVDMHNAHTVELTRLRQENDQRHAENQRVAMLAERRGKFTLRLMADLARKFDVDKRVDDEVILFLTDDTEDR